MEVKNASLKAVIGNRIIFKIGACLVAVLGHRKNIQILRINNLQPKKIDFGNFI